MRRCEEFYHIKPHELMKLVNMSIGAKHVADIMHKSLPQVYRYATAPNNSPDTPWTPGPFARVDSLMDALVNAGDLQTARAVAGRWAHLVGCRLVELAPAHPDRATVEGECVDDLPALAALHAAICRENPSYTDVLEKYEAMQRELAETLEKFREKMLAEQV